MATEKTTEGMYFVVKSRVNDLVLDVAGSESTAGAELVLCQREPDNVNQIWYEDQVTGTICCKSNDLCLTISGDNILTVDNYDEHIPKQEWVLAKDRIQSKIDQKLVIGIKDDSAEPGATMCEGQFNKQNSQLWDIQYLEAAYFYIVSEMHGKVVTVRDAERRPDAKLVLEPKREGAFDQLWHEGKHGFVRSKLNNFVLEATKEETGASIHLMPFEPGNTKQLWCRHKNKIVSLVHPKNLLGIKHKSKDNGAKLVVNHETSNCPSHEWRFEEA